MRYWFGMSPSDWTMELDENRAVLARGGVPMTFWSSATGGTQYTDLLLEDGTPASVIYSGDGVSAPLGAIPRFQGPEDVPVLYVDTGVGHRWALFAINLGSVVQSHLTDIDPHGDRAYAEAYVDSKVLNASGGLGVVRLEDFSGANDNEKFSAALTYLKAQTYKPTLVLPNRSITLSAGPWEFFDGLRISGPIAGVDREFQSSSQCVVTLSAPMFRMPADGSNVKDMSFRGIHFKAANSTVDWMVRITDFSNGPQMQDADFRDIAWNGFASVMHARHLRCSIERMYCNNGTDVQFKIGGSDNYYWTEGYSFLSGSLPVNSYYIYFTHMSRTTVGELYITPQYATAVRLDGSYGNLVFRGTRFDCTGRTLSNACQGSAIFINAGEGYVFDGCWFFNNAVNPSATGRSDKGQVYIKAGVKEVLFTGCQWNGGAKQTLATPSGTPAIYCQSGVVNVRVSNPLAPNSGEKKLQQAASGIITCDDPTWTITTSA